jgi:hypothetical protein
MLPVAAQVIAADPKKQFQGIDPNLLGQNFLRLTGAGISADQLKRISWTQQRGIPTADLAMQTMAAMRQVPTAQGALALEDQMTRRFQDVYQAQQFQQGISVIGAMPQGYGQQQFGREPFQAAWAANQLALSPNMPLAQMGAQVYGAAQISGGAVQLPQITPYMTDAQRFGAYQQTMLQQQGVSTREQAIGLRFGQRQADTLQQMGALGPVGSAQANRILALAQGGAQIGGGQIGLGTDWAMRQGMTVQGAAIGQAQLGAAQRIETLLGPGTSTGVTSFMGQGIQQTNWMQRLMSYEPVAMTQAAQAGAISSQFSMMDINLQGNITGLSPMTTSLQLGAQTGAQTAANVWGANWNQAATPWRQAAVQGLGSTYQGQAVPQYMQGVGGMWALQWAQRQAGYQAQAASAGNQMAQLNLIGEYQPKFWAVEDQQRDLSREQSRWGFEYQQQSMAMQGRQFMESQALNRQGQLMQRSWQMQDWGTQDQMRGMQWGWRQEDFQENLRFMTGRERKQAEKQMQRETTLYGAETEQIEKQRERQKELWRLEDERHNLTLKQFREQQTLQQENLDKQMRFFEEGARLQDEMTRLQREYWLKNHELQKAAVGIQAEYAEKTKQLQEDMDALVKSEDLRMGSIKVAMSNEELMLKTLIDGFNHIIQYAPDALKSILSENQTFIPPYTGSGSGSGGGGGGSGTGGNPQPEATGGPMLPGRRYLVGDRGMEIIKSPRPLSVTPNNELMAQLFGGKVDYDPWQQATVSFQSPQGGGGGGGPITLVINLGNERFAQFILQTLTKDLEVSA